jgi:2-keto-3-deoxy-6-phosphogluconate aldolase
VQEHLCKDIFPAGSAGPQFIKDLLGPFKGMKLFLSGEYHLRIPQRSCKPDPLLWESVRIWLIPSFPNEKMGNITQRAKPL